MSLPSIADVKAAAEIDPLNSDQWTINHAETLRAFANAILSAPGMTAERLEEIQERCWGDDAEMWKRQGDELLAEVLRIRVEQAFRDLAAEDHGVFGTALSDSTPNPDGTHSVDVQLR